MDDHRDQRLARAGMAAAVVAAFGASICCIGPILAATFGITSLAALIRYEPLRPMLAGVTVVFLAGAFVLSYRKRADAACPPGSLCETHSRNSVQRVNRTVLWITAIVVLAVLTFPMWSSWILG
jgi:mercuric ion transport protein